MHKGSIASGPGGKKDLLTWSEPHVRDKEPSPMGKQVVEETLGLSFIFLC